MTSLAETVKSIEKIKQDIFEIKNLTKNMNILVKENKELKKMIQEIYLFHYKKQKKEKMGR